MKSKLLILLLSSVITGCSLTSDSHNTCVEVSVYDSGILMSRYRGYCDVEINTLKNNVVINCARPLVYKDIDVNDSIEIIVETRECNEEQ